MKYSESQALVKVASYCSKAERTEFDIRQKLQKWEIEDDTIKRIIERLIKENFIDEERYCRSYIKDKSQFNKWGKNKIIFELKKKRISSATINACFEDTDSTIFDGQLVKLLQSKVKTVKASNDYERKIKLTRFALGRGYTLDQIKKCMSELYKNDDNEYLEFLL